MNIMIFVALFDRKIRTPTTVLMQGLALADSLTALCTYGFEPLFVAFYDKLGKSNLSPFFIGDLSESVSLKYPLCWLHFLVTNLSDTFHLASVLLTTSLGLQKDLAVLCPIWTKTKITERKAGVVCAICFLFASAISIPRLFIVSFAPGKREICVMSEPHVSIQKYVLAFQPIVLTVVLSTAVVAMIISTCYIVFILCHRKRIRGHASASNSEKKSCVLVLSVMGVFLLSEVPRLYINSTIFVTFRTDLERNENIAFDKMRTAIKSKEAMACSYHTDNNEEVQLNITNYNSCIVNDLPPTWVTKVENYTVDRLLSYEHIFQHIVKNKYLSTIGIFEFSSYDRLRQELIPLVKNMYCSGGSFDSLDNREFYPRCITGSLLELQTSNIVLHVLGSTPYSEPLNYTLNIIWGHLDINLRHLKIFIEILKLFMIVGCSSNFIIYILMSEKLRKCLARKMKCCRETQEKRPEDIEMD
ncbi:TAAR [Mytilus coruscus]|uniref:TAAR n=1 Tax=Mytilus coruscus TaxID=42192 RepID=A0A6J8CCP0_MYTCO|nr:TAAR [Mytilus coruscus]